MKMLKMLCVILICLFLAGCLQFHKLTTLRIKGKGIEVPLGSIAPVEGEDVQATLTREVHFTTDKQKNVTPFSDVDMNEESFEAGGVKVKK